ncbi:uncharacterized protein LOC141903756 [Tubulanus polymorphus]|uniref:uncharacterized protein LOC141903756 n=1 Tax=Tubulanus polymorphus TaxID=672921 RepID=UPI003DA2C5F3
MYAAKQAWAKVTPKTIKNCYVSAGFAPLHGFQNKTNDDQQAADRQCRNLWDEFAASLDETANESPAATNNTREFRNIWDSLAHHGNFQDLSMEDYFCVESRVDEVGSRRLIDEKIVRQLIADTASVSEVCGGDDNDDNDPSPKKYPEGRQWMPLRN